MLSFYIEVNKKEFEGKTVIELGCGPALASIVASLAEALCVVATDGDLKSIELAKRNAGLNNCKSMLSSQLLWYLLYTMYSMYTYTCI